jgi:hypothetical protein
MDKTAEKTPWPHTSKDYMLQLAVGTGLDEEFSEEQALYLIKKGFEEIAPCWDRKRYYHPYAPPEMHATKLCIYVSRFFAILFCSLIF